MTHSLPEPAFDFAKLQSLTLKERSDALCEALILWLEQLSTPCFALPSLLQAIAQANQSGLLEAPLHLCDLERWLMAHRERAVRYQIRGKIAGRLLPRQQYQRFFPLSMDRQLIGPHLVTAHSSPDLDTAVASFWSWLDAFAAELSSGLTLWNLPGGGLSEQDAQVFFEYFGPELFQLTSRNQELLVLQASDLATPLLALQGDQPIDPLSAAQLEQGVVWVDAKGYYRGDWCQSDAQLLLPIIERAIEQVRLLAPQLEAEFERTSTAEKRAALLRQELLPQRADSGASKPTSLDHLLELLLGCSLNQPLSQLFEQLFSQPLCAKLNLHPTAQITASNLQQALEAIVSYLGKLETAVTLKQQLFGLHSEPIEADASVELVRARLLAQKRGLTVVSTQRDGAQLPLGTIGLATQERRFLGSVSLRDFSNRDEVRLSDYLEVISVIDHHKSDLQTCNPSVVLLSDTQSCNTLIAELQMDLNDRYSCGGLSAEQLAAQLAPLRTSPKITPSERRLLQRLLQREQAFEHSNSFVAPARERLEYLFYLYAILDDTDLLAKVSERDLRCVAQLLNRVASLEQGRELELVELDETLIEQGQLREACRKLLQHPAMYAIYSKAYSFKESALSEQIERCSKGLVSALFCDTKIQNSCARVGQLKLTPALFPLFHQHRSAILERWLADGQALHRERPKVDLFIQMISTVAGAQEVYEAAPRCYTHRDELWVWTPECCSDHLSYFLQGMRQARELQGLSFEAEFAAPDPTAFEPFFQRCFSATVLASGQRQEGALVILRFEPSKLNSRKAIISPYLPKVS